MRQLSEKLSRVGLYSLCIFFCGASWVLAQAQTSEKPSSKPPVTKAQAASPTPKEPPVQPALKVFEIKHVNVNSLAQALSVFGLATPNRDLRVISVNTRAALLPVVEETIRRLDVPPKNIELTAHLLMASDQESTVNTAPAELEGVIRQLKATFAYKGFQTLDTLIVRSRDKTLGSVKGVVRLNQDESPAQYAFQYSSVSLLPDEKGRIIRVDNLRLTAQVPVRPNGSSGYTVVDTGFATDLDIREGQKVVVGKAIVDGTNNALILVVTARVVE